MIHEQELRELLLCGESDHVERTISVDNTDKFCEAICAFANDMPGHNLSGYLIIGARDDGTIEKIDVNDSLLKRLSDYIGNGMIVPLPSANVCKLSLPEGDLAIVEVQPSDMPPLRYKGRVYIRRGPRKAIANEQEERILTERRTHHARTFDLRPCKGCGQDELALDLFQLTYRYAALAPEIIEENNRDMLAQMASLGFWCMNDACATNAGALLFAQNPLQWFPGAAIQYVRYEGAGLDSDPLDDRRFEGDLITVLRELDGFLSVLFPSRPYQVTPLREESRSPYPMPALRELLMNAVMHRDYESNAPIRFYWFSDRIEIQNAGGLYGAVNRQTFLRQNDYRNPKIAEAMKNLGYVNTFGRGIARAQRYLDENGNPPVKFYIDEPAYFLATIKERPSRANDHVLQ